MKYSLEDSIPILEEIMARQELCVFAGAGVSVKSDLPSWNELIFKFVELAKTLPFDPTHPKKQSLDDLIADIEIRISKDQFDPILAVSTLKKALLDLDIKDKKKNNLVYSKYKSWVAGIFSDKHPNEYHRVIVSTSFPLILTTNYDLLFQEAANELGIYAHWKHYSYKEGYEVMAAANKKTPSIIYVHGAAEDLDIDELILTREDYNSLIYRKHDAFEFALRMIFTRFSTLFVGYGGSDPHIGDIFQEISQLFPLTDDDDQNLPYGYILMKKDKVDSLITANMQRLRMHVIEVEDYDDIFKLLNSLNQKFPITK